MFKHVPIFTNKNYSIKCLKQQSIIKRVDTIMKFQDKTQKVSKSFVYFFNRLIFPANVKEKPSKSKSLFTAIQVVKPHFSWNYYHIG